MNTERDKGKPKGRASRGGGKKKNPGSRKEPVERPKKDYPTVMGRAEWFQGRAGCRSGATSLGRLTSAMAQQQSMPTPEERSAAIVEEGIERLCRVRGDTPKSAFIIDAGGERITRLRAHDPKRKQGIAAASPIIDVPEFRGDRALIYVPLDVPEVPVLDLRLAALVRMDHPKHPMLIEAAGVWDERQMLIGEIASPGGYQVWAYPRDRWVRTAFDTLCLYWDWIQYEPRIRERIDVGRVKEIPGMVDRICQLILCAPEFGFFDDPAIFEEIGVGVLLGDLGMPGVGGNICDQCLGQFIGDLVIDKGLVYEPPVLKFCRPHKRKCSKWESIGPFPGEDFWGIGRVTQHAPHGGSQLGSL